MRLIQWSRQRRIAYPWHVCAALNDNWCPWSDYMPRRRARRGGVAQTLPPPDAIRFVAQTFAEHLISWMETADDDEDE